jgi:hypothetical protein
MLNQTMLENPTEQDEQALRTAPLDELVAVIRDYLDVWTQRSFVDDEVIWYAGVIVGKTKRNGIDKYVREWINKEPTSERIAIGCSFLFGYWRFASELDLPMVDFLLDLVEKSPRESSTYATALYVLYAGFAEQKSNVEDSYFQSVRRVLLDQLEFLEESDLHPGARDTLSYLRS